MSAIEALEVRTLLAAITVDTGHDVVDAGDGVTSLREAIQQANGDAAADDIVFDTALNGWTITLGGTELSITESVTIAGPGSGLLTIDANNASRIFNLDGDIDVMISGLTPTRGFVERVGGAIISNCNLTLDDVVVTDSMVGDADSFTFGDASDGSLTDFTRPFGGNGSVVTGIARL